MTDSSEQGEALRACPFCGAEAAIYYHGGDGALIASDQVDVGCAGGCTITPRVVSSTDPDADENLQWAITEWNSRASVAVGEGDAQTIYADGYCARCSELAYPLTRALEKTGVPTGADNWQQTYGPNKVRALADLESCLRRLLNALEEGKPEDVADRIQWAKHFIEFHAAIRRRLTALAQQSDTAAAASSPAPAEPPLPNAPDVDPSRKCWASTTSEACADPRGCDDRGCQLYADEDYRAKRDKPTSRDIRAELIAAHSTPAEPVQPEGERSLHLAYSDGYHDGFRQGQQSRVAPPPETPVVARESAVRAAEEIAAVEQPRHTNTFISLDDCNICTAYKTRIVAIITRCLGAMVRGLVHEIVSEMDRRALLADSRGDRPISAERIAEITTLLQPIVEKYWRLHK